ncbi:MAG: glutamine synthetase GlnII [Myxococcota bacterium]
MLKAEYIWLDGTEPTPLLRSKTRVLPSESTPPQWSFDGSSTNQAEGHASDCLLEPVFVCPDPLRGGEHRLVLCEVLNVDGTPHRSNSRARLREVATRHAAAEPWFGIEQEYTMFKNNRPLGWPEGGYPAPQGPFYCGVGADEAFGRDIVEQHLDACITAGLTIYGINAEVMPGQWEFQIGTAGPMEVADHLTLARYLLYRVGESYETSITLHPKPVRGDWNGAGAHTNFSTRAMREPGGMAAIHAAIEKLRGRHDFHIANYGHGIEQRLTGLHETCSYKEFKFGESDRGASIRIPPSTVSDGHGYFEDRRPGANIDPYVVCRILIETVCG